MFNLPLKKVVYLDHLLNEGDNIESKRICNANPFKTMQYAANYKSGQNRMKIKNVIHYYSVCNAIEDFNGFSKFTGSLLLVQNGD